MRSNDVATWLLRHEHDMGARPSTSNMKLQKLVYLGESCFGSLYGEELVSEPFQAWPHGPAVKPLYGLYKRFGSNPITEVAGYSNPVPEEVEDVLETVWDYFGDMEAWQLRNLTHDIGPYDRHFVDGVQDIIIPKPEIHFGWEEFLAAGAKRHQSPEDRLRLADLDRRIAQLPVHDDSVDLGQLMTDYRLFASV